MTKLSDYVGWFDDFGSSSNGPHQGGTLQGGTLARGAEVGRLLVEPGIDPTGLKPSNLLRTIARTFDANVTRGRSTAKQTAAAST